MAQIFDQDDVVNGIAGDGNTEEIIGDDENNLLIEIIFFHYCCFRFGDEAAMELWRVEIYHTIL